MNGEALLWLPQVLRDAGLQVVEYGGWDTRSRSSGGFTGGKPFAVFWHHTASSTSPEGDANYMCYVSADRPIANLMVPDDGTIWVLAAGCTNTNGKGKSIPFSRGTVGADSANTGVVGMEICNNGVGEGYSPVQIDVAFIASNAINARMGNQPTDVSTHHFYAPDRKIDPATAAAVQGGWVPSSINSSGTWSQDDLEAECSRRVGGAPPEPPVPPTPPPGQDWVQWVMENQPVLRQGDSGVNVKRMQHLLAAAGFMKESNVSNYDGQFGSGTAGALNSFKQAAGGAADGTCDSWTWGALMHTIDGIPDIAKGASGADVKRMQHLLAANGFMNEANVSNYDGQWGNGTDSAKAKFDNAHGLTPSPPTDCGAKSWESLLNGWHW